MPPRAATLPLLVLQGDWTEAQGLAVTTRAHGSPLERQMAVMILGVLARHQGNHERAWSMVSELLPRGLASEPEDGLFPYAIEMLRLAASLALDAGDFKEASAWLNVHDEWLDWSGAMRGRSESRRLRARCHHINGDFRQAELCLVEALNLAGAPRQPLALMAAHRSLGQVALDCGEHARAEISLRQALSMAEDCAAPFERARALLGLARIDYASGSIENGHPRLSEAREIAVKLGAVPLVLAVDEFESLPAAETPAYELTERQIEILRLVADGLTDAEVADQLYISPRTVGQHLRTIYNKLGVSSRAAATRVAVEHGLL